MNRGLAQARLEVGYANPSHFAQLFRRETGLSPSDYPLRLVIPVNKNELFGRTAMPAKMNYVSTMFMQILQDVSRPDSPLRNKLKTVAVFRR